MQEISAERLRHPDEAAVFQTLLHNILFPPSDDCDPTHPKTHQLHLSLPICRLLTSQAPGVHKSNKHALFKLWTTVMNLFASGDSALFLTRPEASLLYSLESAIRIPLFEISVDDREVPPFLEAPRGSSF